MTDYPLNHNEAWSLAHMKSPESNMARCYIDLREAAKAVIDAYAPMTLKSVKDDPIERLRAIANSNDL